MKGLSDTRNKIMAKILHSVTKMYIRTYYEPSYYNTVLIPRVDYFILQSSCFNRSCDYLILQVTLYVYLTVKIKLGP